MWTWPGMGQCLDHHADVTFQRRARPPFWDLLQTQHITAHGRSGLRATRPRLTLYDRAHSSQETRRRSWKCSEVPRIVVYRFRDALKGRCFMSGRGNSVSANFQINTIPYWKLVWMDRFFLRSPPDEGQSEEHTDWGYRRESCWACLLQMSLCFHCCCTFITRWLPSVR